MVSWLRPGGVLVVEEPWIDVARLAPDPIVGYAVEALGREVDVGFARRLPAAFGRSASIGAGGGRGQVLRRRHETGRLLPACPRGCLRPLVASGDLERGGAAASERFDDPGFSDCGWPRIGAVGWKPGAELGAARERT
jgi:hypothetical protein